MGYVATTNSILLQCILFIDIKKGALMLLSQKRQGVWDCHLGSTGRGSWCFANYDAEIDKMTESKTRKGEIFHTFHTRFGSLRIGGPEQVKAIDVLPRDTVVLYETRRPIEPKLYYGR